MKPNAVLSLPDLFHCCPVKEMGRGSLSDELTEVVITALVAVIHGPTGVELS